MKKTNTKAFSNLVGAVIFIIVGIWAWFQAAGFKEVNNTYVQPALFSQIMIVGMLICAVVLLIQSIFKLMSMKPTDPLAEPTPSINIFKDRGVQAAVATIVLCILFVALFRTLGYVLCSICLSMIIMIMIGKRNWIQMILVSILVPLGMWFIFYKVLTVNIPMGPLTFLRDLVDKF